MNNSAKKRILYIGPVPPSIGGTAPGGIATHAWQLATQANKRGYEVYILANTTLSFVKDGIHILKTPSRSPLIRLLLALKFLLKGSKGNFNSLDDLAIKTRIGALSEVNFLKKTLQSVKPDVIHIHSITNRLFLSLMAFDCRIPIIVTHHGIEPGKRSKENIKVAGKAFSFAEHIICVSDHSLKQLEVGALTCKAKVKVIHNPVNAEDVPFLGRNEAKREIGLEWDKIALFSGIYKTLEIKGLDILLKAFARDPYLSDNCKLLVIADREGISRATVVFNSGAIKGKIISRLPWQEVVKYYSAADVFVLPSRSESFGIVYVEALLAGTPVVGFHETLEEIEQLLGIYIGEKYDAGQEDEKTLALKIKKVLNTGFDRKLLRNKVMEKLSWETKFSEFDAVYRETLKMPGVS